MPAQRPAPAGRLILSLDDLDGLDDPDNLAHDGGRARADSVADAVAEVMRTQPMWLRVTDFFQRTLDVLEGLPTATHVLWRISHRGLADGVVPLTGSPGVNPARYAESMLGSVHHVVPYTFVDGNIRPLLSLAPALHDAGLRLLPIAQKEPVPGAGRDWVRRTIGVASSATLYGVAGRLDPTKGVEDVVEGFVRTCHDHNSWLLASVVIDDDDQLDAATVWSGWSRRFAEENLRRVRLRVSRYIDWSWMCEFYRAVDVVLVDAVSASRGRSVAEPLGFGVPVVVRRAACATNHVAPGVVRLDRFDDFGAHHFLAAVAEARRRAPGLRHFVQRQQSIAAVRERFRRLMRRATAPPLLPVFDAYAADPVQLAELDKLIVY
jgi:glycosyltransferase involved in cell wall biosynthesis